MAETDVDRLGPVDWMVVEFPGPDFGKGQVAPILTDYVDRSDPHPGHAVPQKTRRRTLEPFEISDLGEGELGELRLSEADLAIVLSEQDVLDLAETMDPNTSAVLLVWENLWAAPFGSTVRHAGGQLVASGRISTQAVLAAIEANDEEGA